MSKLFKSHIDNLKLELSGKAGRTRQEMQEALNVQELHKLSSNENALGPSPKAQEAIKNCVQRLHEYDYRTDDVFREALSSHFNGEIGPEQFVTTNSGLEIIELIMQGFLEPGDQVIISNPTFHVYEIFGTIQGAEIVDVPLDPDSFALDVQGIHEAVTDKTKLVILANPNNPTGVSISRKEMDAVIHNMPDHVVVLIDEVYYHFHESEDFPFANDYIKAGYQVIGMHSFSKAYGLAGIRLAYGFTSERLAAYLQKLRRPFFINTMTMEAGLAALNDAEHIKATQALIHSEKKKLYAAFDRLGLKYWPSHTNFILVKPNRSHDAVIQDCLERGVMVRSGDNNGAMGCIRITIGLPSSNDALIKALTEVL